MLIPPPAGALRAMLLRPSTLIAPCARCRLKNGMQHAGGFEHIGTPQEQSPLVLADLQSYDEMALSALVGMSVPTHFINEGGRRNRGEFNQVAYEPKGVYAGLVGARFERPRLMEWKHLIVEPEQNTVENGYGPAPEGYVAGSDVHRELLQARPPLAHAPSRLASAPPPLPDAHTARSGTHMAPTWHPHGTHMVPTWDQSIVPLASVCPAARAPCPAARTLACRRGRPSTACPTFRSTKRPRRTRRRSPTRTSSSAASGCSTWSSTSGGCAS